jgi:hypothetical protein
VVVDWRYRIRPRLNWPDDLSGWRLALMRLFDPVEWYMRKDVDRPLPRGRRAREERSGVAYAPLAYQRQEGESDERADAPAGPSRSAESPVEDREERKTDLSERYRGYFAARAREVVAGQPVVIRTANGTVRARLVRFRNGAVLERDVLAPSSTGHEMTRVDRRALRDPAQVIENHLIDGVAELGPDAEPLT